MTREWKPGDSPVAVISWRSQSGRSGGTVLAFRASREYDESHWITDTFGEIPDHKVVDIRPLVVIDPEDEKAVERLATLFGTQPDCLSGFGFAAMQAALREFANPTPPKPEEPTGLGAVVEDAAGVRHVRAFSGMGNSSAWLGHIKDDGGERRRKYLEIDAVRVLSAGVDQ